MEDDANAESLHIALRAMLKTIHEQNVSDGDLFKLENDIKRKLTRIIMEAGENPFDLISAFTSELVNLFVGTKDALFVVTLMSVFGMMAELECLWMQGESDSSYMMAS